MGDLRSFKKYLMLNWGSQLYVFGVGYCIFVVLLLSGTNICYICEQLYGEGNFQKTIAFIGIVFVETMVNLVLFTFCSKYNRLDYLIDREKLRCSSGTSPPDKAEMLCPNSGRNPENPNFPTRYCVHCKFRVPHICHHCPMCNYCVFKKDHHCFFMGGCVGFGNQRYFIVFLFWSTLGSMYALFLVFRFIIDVYKPNLPFAWARYIFPIYVLMAIYELTCHKDEILCMLYVSVVICGACGSAWFFFYQWLMVVKGKSTMGFFQLKDLFPANGNPTISQRIRYVFGPYWPLNFLVPLPFRNKLDESYERLMLAYYSEAAAIGCSIPEKLKTH
ncbi:hypothetical protein M514_08097 [Trichuris suis]|uniref:Palmitoyltransferase n=1 Tax=Trichuris suis TaxID=68888 RepID=A0A085NUX4_9BILA|nr:hypothetical protein M513_08097 [Trichuris suis]KFD73270.1 hypothetical protein M514_08097 [Trichuris suis]